MYQYLTKMISNFPHENFSKIQFAEHDKIIEIQNSLFLKHLKYVAENSTYYTRKFQEIGLNYHDIKSIHDIENLPFTNKSDLNLFNNDFLAVSPDEIIDICLTSSSTGKSPTKMLQTKSDLYRLSYNEEVAFAMTGLQKKDIVFNSATLDRCFMAGLAYFLGGVKLGVCIVRGGGGNTAQTWESIKMTNATALVGVPSLLIKIADHAINIGEDPSEIGIKRLIAIGEPTRDKDLNLLPVSNRIEDYWGAKIYSTYASTELSTTFCECEIRQGGHMRPEMIVSEIIDKNGDSLTDGEIGEVVVTPLGVSGMPLLRFKTGDISYMINDKCDCGRTTPRIAPILGRKNEMLKYKGTTIFPNAILSAIEDVDEYYAGFVEAHENADKTDRIILYLAAKGKDFSLKRIKDKLKSHVRVVPEIKILSKEKIDCKIYVQGKRKRITFYDFRSGNG